VDLANTYRPKTFDDVLGQGPVIKSLKHVIKDGRAHSFIFAGPSGTGKTTLARILVSEFGGADRTAANSEEVIAASKSGADAMRELVTRTLYRAIGGSPIKFIIIDECHRLSATAWDVLLKPLEEPPAHVYYALCTTDPSKIPKAILTRCLRYDLKPVKEELILGLLVDVCDTEGFDTRDDILEVIAEECNGSPRQALVFLEACLSCKGVNDARAVIRTAAQGKELVALARWLVAGKALSWAEATRYLKDLQDQDGESCRIVITAYLSAVLLNTKNDKVAVRLLTLLECFSRPYLTSDKFAPLMLSVGLAIGMDSQ
jgi:DNA polymerase III gamma/tau subunit